MTRKGWWLLAAALSLAGCKEGEARLAALPFQDSFERAELGPDWRAEPGWSVKDGQVYSAGTRNRALWLQAALPRDAVIELTARSESPAGDIKFEAWGDGQNHASGYVFIFGGWRNSISAIARLDEHGADRQEVNRPNQVRMGQHYRMKVVRQGEVIRWYVDDKLLLDFYDSAPLHGQGHDRFAFNDWEAQLYFDDLRIRPATPEDR
ncbi:MAG TPA: hypothetical protein PK668_24910 [Myxococcota bacterium]|nr:hypothetical protein [Myxococcota bacterium]HRY96818.1 hypothetical protein [Myxococcota bacterium]HSA23779.1 hypothetical protein [Myxococcota bacterium]